MKDITFYHGTDARILRMTDAERFAFKVDCILAISYMWELYEPYNSDMEKLKEPLGFNEDDTLWRNVTDKMVCYSASLNGNEQYHYENLYLTSVRFIAEKYAYKSFAFGEIGLIAYRFWQGLQKMNPSNWNPSDAVGESIKKIVDFATSAPEPVLLEFHIPQDIAFEDLRLDNGCKIDWQFEPQLVQCTRNLSFDKIKKIKLEPEIIKDKPAPAEGSTHRRKRYTIISSPMGGQNGKKHH